TVRGPTGGVRPRGPCRDHPRTPGDPLPRGRGQRPELPEHHGGLPDRPDRRHPARTRRGRQHLGPGRLLGLVVGPARRPHGRRGRRGPVHRDDGRYRCGAGPPPGHGHLRDPASPFHSGGQRVTTAPPEAEEPVTGKEHRKPAEPDRGGRFLPVALYVLGRLGTAVVSLFAVIVAGFFLFRILPGDPV